MAIKPSDNARSILALLRTAFAESALRVSLAGATEAERSRNITFYDEVIVVAVRLTVPASSRTIPAPSQSQHRTEFPIPLPPLTNDGDEEDDQLQDFNSASGVPPMLWLLLACLRISLEAAYIPPRLARPALTESGANAGSGSDEASSSSTQVIASVDEEDTAYQSVRLQQGPNDVTSEATRMSLKQWAGNAAPPKPELKKPASRKGQDAFAAKKQVAAGAEVWFSRDGGRDAWKVEWRCEMPIVFLRSRHPTPALMLNANLTLKLQSSQLSALAPSIAPPTTTTASEALFLHDILSPLSEGPSYPDESPAERAARADASLAKLPLGKLPSSVLGSKLVTPARAAREAGRIVEHGKRLSMQNGDIGDIDEYNSLKAGKRDLTNEGLYGSTLRALEGGRAADEDDIDTGLGEDAVMLQRSARRVMDVRTAVQVRMRTTNIAGVGQQFGSATNSFAHDEAEDLVVPTLILCVEIENPANSGIKFALDDVGVHVAVPSESFGTLHPSNRIHVHAEPIGFIPSDLIVEQGSQYNMLYRVDFDLPFMSSHGSQDTDPTMFMAETQRTITIELFGRPVLLRSTHAGDRAGEVSTEYFSSESFTSTWSCTLDFATQIQSLVLQGMIAEGAGAFALSRLGQVQQQNASSYPTASLGHPSAIMPSVLAQRRFASAQQQLQQQDVGPPTPNKSRPGFGRTQTEGRLSSTPTLSIRPPLRTTSAGLASDTLIALQRSSDGREPNTGGGPRSSLGGNIRSQSSFANTLNVNGPAMPSSLVGPSILARARMNRMVTMGQLPSDSSRSANVRERRAATLVMSSESSSSIAPLDNLSKIGDVAQSHAVPGRVSSASWHVKNALSGSQTLDVHAALPVFPLGSKSTWARMPFVLQNAANEQGLLLDVMAKVKHDEIDSVAIADSVGAGKSQSPQIQTTTTVDVHFQIDNRSELTRTVVLQWKRTAKELASWLPDDDAVQVGPILAGQAELAMMRLRKRSSDNGAKAAANDDHLFSFTSVPPILLTDVESGSQRTLTCIQPLLTA